MGDSMLDTAMTSIVVTLVTFLTGIMLARLLGPEGRGQYGSILFLSQFITSVLTFALFEALVVRLRNRNEAPEKMLSLSLSFAAGLMAIVCLLALASMMAGVSLVDGVNANVALIAALAAVAIGFTNRAFISIESSALSFGRLNLERILSPTLFLAAASVIFFSVGASLHVILFVYLCAQLPIVILRFRHFWPHIQRRIDVVFMREVLALAPRLFMASGTLALAQHTDRLVVVSVWPSEWLGFYFVAMAACGAGFALGMQAIQITLLPILAGLPVEEKRNKVEKLLRLSFLIAPLMAIAIWMLAPWIIPLAYGSEFTPAVGYVQGLMLSMALNPAITIVVLAKPCQWVWSSRT